MTFLCQLSSSPLQLLPLHRCTVLVLLFVWMMASSVSLSTSSFVDGCIDLVSSCSNISSCTFSSDSDSEELYGDFEGSSSSELSSPAESPAKRPKLCSVQDTANTPLYQNSDISCLQSHLLLFQYALKHHLPTRAFTDLLHLLKVHVPPTAQIPSSVYVLRQFFLRVFPESKGEIHAYCTECHRYLHEGQAICEIQDCAGKAAYFVISNLYSLLKKKKLKVSKVCLLYSIVAGLNQLCGVASLAPTYYYTDPDCWMALQKRHSRSVSPGTICDVYDGAAYKEFMASYKKHATCHSYLILMVWPFFAHLKQAFGPFG